MKTYYLPVGIVQEAIHLGVDGQTVHPGQWHLTVYPFTRTICANEWADGQVIRTNRGFTSAGIAGCQSCQAMMHKLVDSTDGRLVIPLSERMAKLRAKRDGYSPDIKLTEVALIP